ncbi:exodeoxyribonuclease VII large subunit [Synechococcus elongatus]|uniref:exodeoxyribonuclease VII large subunit n=1 Tax=Synechococcus elongatus TaxID=32046 RepID=UPI001EDF68D9|nr:exodeoxyribonuclease VII large subunit [Synechococcus elongatus]
MGDRGLSAISVAGVSDYLESLIGEDVRLRQLWIFGEVSSCKPHAVGLFFSLKDSQTTDLLDCVVWKNGLAQLQHRPEVGQQVLLLGTVRLYRKRSGYQLQVVQCLPFGDGLKALQRQKLEQRLQAEGLFDRDRKRPLPLYPQTIAVVTSPQAAAWGDIQRSLRQRSPGLKVLLSPTLVQGEQAPAAISAAIARVGADGRAELLILARGGGAREDLECFDDEQVVRAIATCPIPVVTGLGHEQDETLADRVADWAAHTPTAAAIRSVPAWTELRQAWQQLRQRLIHAQRQQWQDYRRQLQHCQTRLGWPLLQRRLQQAQHQQQSLRQRLQQASRLQLAQERQHLDHLQELLAILNPESVLQRGYALVRRDRTLIQQVQDLQVGDRLSLQWADGTAGVCVETVTAAVENQSDR